MHEDDGQQPRQEEDAFFMDLRDFHDILERHGAAEVAYQLSKQFPAMAKDLAYELTISIKQHQRHYRR